MLSDEFMEKFVEDKSKFNAHIKSAGHEDDDPDLDNIDPEIAKRARKRIETKKIDAKAKIEKFFS